MLPGSSPRPRDLAPALGQRGGAVVAAAVQQVRRGVPGRERAMYTRPGLHAIAVFTDGLRVNLLLLF